MSERHDDDANSATRHRLECVQVMPATPPMKHACWAIIHRRSGRRAVLAGERDLRRRRGVEQAERRDVDRRQHEHARPRTRARAECPRRRPRRPCPMAAAKRAEQPEHQRHRRDDLRVLDPRGGARRTARSSTAPATPARRRSSSSAVVSASTPRSRNVNAMHGLTALRYTSICTTALHSLPVMICRDVSVVIDSRS